jgi:eukaryotic-like serine/threonine-protein kinase
MAADMTGTLPAGRYRTIGRVGSGGMATVLLAEDERLGRQVAIKRLHAESPEDTARRFRREARLGASLNHPNLVAVYDIVTDDEGVLIVMEYVDGETLRDAIARGPVEPARAVEVLRGLAAALDHAHEEGIVHRDVKPANVLLGRDGRTKLADLGIATAVEGTRITMSGTVLGTAAYMAPEQLEGHKAGPAADIYSLAVVAWEMLSGRRAYEGRTPLEIATRKATDPPPSLADVWPEAPPAAVRLLARAMGPDPAARPATATALVDELARALEPSGGERPTASTVPLAGRNGRGRPTAPAASAVRGGRPSWLAPLLAIVAAVAIGAGALSAFGGSDEGSSGSGKGSASAKKSKHSAKKAKNPAAAEQAPATSQPAEPAPAAPSGYQVPQPSGTDAAAGSRLNNQGFALINSGNYDGAIPVLEQAVKSFPSGTTASSNLDYAFTLFNLGQALRKAGRPADAVPVLTERLENPDQIDKVRRELDLAGAGAKASG